METVSGTETLGLVRRLGVATRGDLIGLGTVKAEDVLFERVPQGEPAVGLPWATSGAALQPRCFA